jgi:hypothetical protein
VPLRLHNFIEHRSFLYHVTAHKNLPFLRTRTRLLCTHNLLAEAGRAGETRVHRSESVGLSIGNSVVIVRDQIPLRAANIEFPRDFYLEDLVEHLNIHVFLWPGTDDGPCKSGQRYLKRYCGEQPALIRLPTVSVMSTDAEPLFCRYNSGAPRWAHGRPSPRDPTKLFQTAINFRGTSSNVVEVVFRDYLTLPPMTELQTADGTWTPLFTESSSDAARA